MIPQGFLPFFAASLTADGALIGLLFVAIAIEPGNIFDGKNQERELAASGAFTSLVNAFMISLFALVPGINVGWAIIILAGISLFTSIIHATDKLRRGQRSFNRSLFYTSSALLLYGLEIYYSIQFIQQPRNNFDALYTLIYVMAAIYAVSLTRAWTLLGAEQRSITRIVYDIISRRFTRLRESSPAGDKRQSLPPV